MSQKKAAVVLAAGKGTRMESDLPKVLHEIKGRPIVSILLDTLKRLDFDKIVVVIGYEGERVKAALADYDVAFAWQHEQRGTGDAVKSAQEQLQDFEGVTMVAAGDVPFLSAQSIGQLFSHHEDSGAAATCLTAILDDPSKYGRIIRTDDGRELKEIVEYKDASEEIRQIREINTGTFAFDNKLLFDALGEVSDDNAQGEYYLTDVVKILHDRGLAVGVVTAENPDEVKGINRVAELQELAEIFGDQLN